MSITICADLIKTIKFNVEVVILHKGHTMNMPFMPLYRVSLHKVYWQICVSKGFKASLSYPWFVTSVKTLGICICGIQYKVASKLECSIQISYFKVYFIKISNMYV